MPQAQARFFANWSDAAIVGVLALFVELAAALSGGDASWDMRNYHLYNPFALLHKAPGVDIAPAHMQTWFSPTLDLFYYTLARTIPVTPALNAVAALPHALAVVLTYILSCRLMQADRLGARLIAGLAVLISATGAAAAPTLATTMDEMLPASLFLLGLLTLIPGDLASVPGPRRVFVAGLLAGAACGLKLTVSYAALGLAVALLAMPWRGLGAALGRWMLLGAGGLLGALLLSGYWWAELWSQYGNPLFPMYNHIVRSPLVAPLPYIDPAFLPRSLPDALATPWVWALQLYRGASESRLRDPRFALAMIAAVLCLVQDRRGRRCWPIALIAVWFLVSFALWRVEFSVMRYLSLPELFTGPLIALAVLPLARRMGDLRPALAGMALLCLPLFYLTVYSQYARSARGTAPFQVDAGPVSPDAMVLLLDTSPMAYLAVFQDPRVRFVATNDYFMRLDPRENPMQAKVAAAIAGHTGELWGLDTPELWGTQGDQSLAAYKLTRGECHWVVSNVSPEPIRMCRLRKAGSTETAQSP